MSAQPEPLPEGSRVDNPDVVAVPPCFSREVRVDGNRARQMLSPQETTRLDATASPPCLKRSDGTFITLVAGEANVPSGVRALYLGRDGLQQPLTALRQRDRIHWVGDLSPIAASTARASWTDCLTLALANDECHRPGLRLPQLGAVHSILGYWTLASTQPATVVMPTGTGKTETMIALLAAAQPERLLVVVPSDVLRTQIASKFESFGILQSFGVISRRALRPVVGQLKHAFSNPDSARSFADATNVIVTTPQALFAASPQVTEALLESCSHLFVDEAHHVEAVTWRQIRDSFTGKPVVQFTATPYREDGRRIAGQILYTFPLGQAQAQGYFSRINYISIVEFNDPDRAIALAAIEQLRKDLTAGLDHLLLARVRRIGRAQEIRALYEQLAPDLVPVVLHSSLPKSERQLALSAIHTRHSRIIVCVDMLGEGFDLPSLKIAAIHDPHKSLGITLQFIGRFARVASVSIGEASVVTGRPEGPYDESLRKLYSEDPDWNLIIRDLSEAAVGEEREVSEFEAGFPQLPDLVSLRNVEPKMSTVVFRTNCQDWNPHAIYDLCPEGSLLTDPIAVNEQHHVAWFVLENRSPVRWGEIETLADTAYDLYVLYWDERNQLLYINSSNTESELESWAKAVCGDDVQRFTGEAVYRAMAHIKRLVPTNVGLLDIRNRSRRFSMHVGADVTEGFPVAEAQTKTKTNIFAYGYEDGARVNIGGSLKGRVWSHRVAPTLKHWMDWCDYVGGKVSDTGISVDEVMRGFIRPKTVETRPPYVALALEWSWEAFLSLSEEIRVSTLDGTWPLIDTELRITSFSTDGPITFAVETPSSKVTYEINFDAGRMHYRPFADEISVVTRYFRTPLSQYLSDQGLTIFFEQDAMVVPPGILLKPDRDLPAFERNKLTAVDWAGVNIRKESMGPNRDADSVQARVLQYVQSLGPWEIIVDDDGTGEIADIVAIRCEEERLVVALAHCKYSTQDTPGARLDDLYVVCGQAQKSVRWRRNLEVFFRRLVQREQSRVRNHSRSGFVLGNGNTLYRLRERARFLKPDFTFLIAQPGLSKNQASTQQLDLLGSTETYLYEVANASFGVLCSD